MQDDITIDELVWSLHQMERPNRVKILTQPLIGCLNAIQLALLMGDYSIINQLEHLIGLENLSRIYFEHEHSLARHVLHYITRYEFADLVSKVIKHPFITQDGYHMPVKFALNHGTDEPTITTLMASDCFDPSSAGLISADFHRLLHTAVKSDNDQALVKVTNHLSSDDTPEFQLDTKITNNQAVSGYQISLLEPLSDRYIISTEPWGAVPYTLIFYNVDNRPGAEKEAEEMKSALESAQFLVYSFERWQEVDELQSKLRASIKEIEDRCSLLFCCIMGHGTRGRLRGTSGIEGEINQVLQIFDEELDLNTPLVSILGQHNFGFRSVSPCLS